LYQITDLIEILRNFNGFQLQAARQRRIIQCIQGRGEYYACQIAASCKTVLSDSGKTGRKADMVDAAAPECIIADCGQTGDFSAGAVTCTALTTVGVNAAAVFPASADGELPLKGSAVITFFIL
jgi:hypothetical protein